MLLRTLCHFVCAISRELPVLVLLTGLISGRTPDVARLQPCAGRQRHANTKFQPPTSEHCCWSACAFLSPSPKHGASAELSSTRVVCIAQRVPDLVDLAVVQVRRK